MCVCVCEGVCEAVCVFAGVWKQNIALQCDRLNLAQNYHIS